MKRMLSVFVIFCLSAIPVFGDGPKDLHVVPSIKIVGAETPIPYGELVQIDAEVTGKGDNIISEKYSWRVYDKDFNIKRARIEGKSVIFGSGVKKAKFLVTFVATYTFVDKDAEGKITGTETVVTDPTEVIVNIGDDKPVPPDPDVPDPDVPPTPPKPLPDSPLGLVQPSISAFDTMEAENKAVIAKIVGDNYNLIKNKIAGKKITSLAEAYKQLSELNGAGLRANKANFAEWNTWDQSIKKAVYDLYLAKKLTVLEDYIGAFAEIANSLTYSAEKK